MPRPTAIEAAIRFRQQLARQEAASFERMSRLYSRIALAVSDELQALADEIAQAGETGKQLDRTKILKFERFQVILRQIERRVTDFGGAVANEVTLVQGQAIRMGTTNALELIERSFPPNLPDDVLQALIQSFTRLSPDAIESAAGLLAEDSPLAIKLRQNFGEAVRDQVETHLLDGMGVGLNPRTIARKLAANLEGSLGLGLKWALTTVRTAQIKSYQLANHLTYQANPDLVKGWRWHSALDSRTCLSCISKHGKLFPVSETLRDHHNGRCSPIPETITYADLGLPGVRERRIPTVQGEDWFKQQPAAIQREMMGGAMYRAWQDGAFRFDDLSREQDDDVYGQLFTQASLKGILGDRAKDYYANGNGGRQRATRPPERQKTTIAERPPKELPFKKYPDDEGRREITISRSDLESLEKDSERWIAELSEEEKAAMDYWSGLGYRQIRRDIDANNLTDENTINFLTALERAPTTNDVTWRGIIDSVRGVPDFPDMQAEAILEKWRRAVGTEIQWTAPSSASLDPGIGSSFGASSQGVVFEVRSNKGRYINALNRFAGGEGDEMEVIFPPYSRFKVIEVKRVSFYNIERDVERERLTVVLEDAS